MNYEQKLQELQDSLKGSQDRLATLSADQSKEVREVCAQQVKDAETDLKTLTTGKHIATKLLDLMEAQRVANEALQAFTGKYLNAKAEYQKADLASTALFLDGKEAEATKAEAEAKATYKALQDGCKVVALLTTVKAPVKVQGEQGAKVVGGRTLDLVNRCKATLPVPADKAAVKAVAKTTYGDYTNAIDRNVNEACEAMGIAWRKA